MRLHQFLLPLLSGSLATAQQVPFLDRAKSYAAQAQAYAQSAIGVAQTAVGSATDAAGSAAHSATNIAKHPVDATAAKIAASKVPKLDIWNWRTVLRHSGTVRPGHEREAWMVLVTGGNKTCAGMCHGVEKAWNESVPILLSTPNGPNLATLDCDNSELLCGAWGCQTGAVWTFMIPSPASEYSTTSPSDAVSPLAPVTNYLNRVQSLITKPTLPESEQTPLTIHNLNFSSVTVGDVTRIHTQRLYDDESKKSEGWMHPFNGWLSRSGLVLPFAYGLWGLSKIPSWALMIGISLFSRQFMTKRLDSMNDRRRQERVGGPGSNPRG